LSQVVSKSSGEASRFTSLLKEYQKAPGVTRERLYIDAIEQVMTDSTKVLMDTKGGNNMLYLPLDKLVQQGNTGPTRSNDNNNQLIDRVANEVIEKLQRNSNQLQSERRR
jgi:membrane protease subunit HflK